MATKKRAAIESNAALENDWRVESDLQTLLTAAAIRKDPKRYKKVQELAKSKMMEVASIASDDEGAEAE